MKKWIRIVTGTVVVVLCMYVLGLIMTHIPSVSERRAATYQEYAAKFGETRFPETAKNIRDVSSSVDMGGRAWIYRFEAPIADCRARALAVYSRYQCGEGVSSTPPEFEPVVEPPHKPQLAAYWIKDLGWFDVESVSNAITLPRDCSCRPFIWIDTERGVLYAYWTD